MAPPSRRSRAAKLPPPAAPFGPVDDDVLAAACRHFGIDPTEVIAASVTAERAVVVTVDGRKLVEEA